MWSGGPVENSARDRGDVKWVCPTGPRNLSSSAHPPAPGLPGAGASWSWVGRAGCGRCGVWGVGRGPPARWGQLSRSTSLPGSRPRKEGPGLWVAARSPRNHPAASRQTPLSVLSLAFSEPWADRDCTNRSFGLVRVDAVFGLLQPGCSPVNLASVSEGLV